MVNKSKIILRDQDGNYIFPLHAHHPQFWTLFGGTIERGEPAIDAAYRELDEESHSIFNSTNTVLKYSSNYSHGRHYYRIFQGVTSRSVEKDIYLGGKEMELVTKMSPTEYEKLKNGGEVKGYTLWHLDLPLLQ